MQPLFQGSSLKSYFDSTLRILKSTVQKNSLEGIALKTLRHNAIQHTTIIPLQLQLGMTKNSQVKGQRKVSAIHNLEYDGMRYEIPFLGDSQLFIHNSPKSRNEIILGILKGNTISVDIIIHGDISTTEVQEKISSDAQELIGILQWYIDEVNNEVENFNNKIESELDQMIKDELSSRADKQSILNNTNPFKESDL
jgi:hypothetical protein